MGIVVGCLRVRDVRARKGIRRNMNHDNRSGVLSGHRRVGLCVAGAFLACAIAAAADDPMPDQAHQTPVSDPEGEVTRLTSEWHRWAQRCQTLRVSGWRFTGSCRAEDSAVSREQCIATLYQQLLSAADGGALGWSSLRDVTTPVFPPLKQPDDGTPCGIWVRFELIDDGEGDGRVRSRELSEVQQVETLRVQEGGREQMYRSHQHQASLFDRHSPLHMDRRQDFLYTPEISRLPGLQFQVDAMNRSILTNGKYSLTYDSASGFVWNEHRRLDESQYLTERIQGLPQATADHCPVPRLSVDIRYWKKPKRTDQPVRLVFAWILDDWELDRIANDDEFKIGVPERTVVAHFPAGQGNLKSGQPRVELTKEPTPDVREFADRPDFGERAKPAPHSARPPTRRPFVSHYVMINLMVLFIIVWLCVWRRR